MNKERRKIIKDVIAKLDDAHAKLEEVYEAEQEAIENMPENLRYSSKGEEREEIADNIEEHMTAVDSLRCELEEIAEGAQ
jgi:predicted  nucleic acid-binding Zn-ribbon protein